jgi:NAD(P)-dependent dehydrogenase (short-subunit alcohol dehydrogenase family)
MELAGRVALITGASGRGMGRSIALTLAREGADIVVNYKERAERAQTVANEIEALGRRAFLHQADTSDPDAVAAMVADATAALGPIDIAVVSAGGSWKPADIAAIEPAHWRDVLAEEIDAAYSVIRALLPSMRERRWGRIILVGGYLADTWPFAPPDAPLDYPLGKAARHWLARTLGQLERGTGVTVNAVAPGPIAYIERDDALRLAREGPSGGDITPQDVAEVVAFLCSERARFVSGAVIPVVGRKEV